jgi:hypothetical protein
LTRATAAIERDPQRYKRFIVSGNIRKYRHTWDTTDVRYIKDSYEKPALDTRHASVKPKRRSQACAHKVIVSGMARDLTCLADEGHIAAGKSTIIVIPHKQELLYFLLGVLNSSTLDRVYKLYFSSLSLAGGYMRFGPPRSRCYPLSWAPPRNVTGLPSLPWSVQEQTVRVQMSCGRKSMTWLPNSMG